MYFLIIQMLICEFWCIKKRKLAFFLIFDFTVTNQTILHNTVDSNVFF